MKIEMPLNKKNIKTKQSQLKLCHIKNKTICINILFLKKNF